MPYHATEARLLRPQRRTPAQRACVHAGVLHRLAQVRSLKEAVRPFRAAEQRASRARCSGRFRSGRPPGWSRRPGAGRRQSCVTDTTPRFVVRDLVEHQNGSHLGLLECAGGPRAARPYPITLLEAKARSVGPMGPTRCAAAGSRTIPFRSEAGRCALVQWRHLDRPDRHRRQPTQTLGCVIFDQARRTGLASACRGGAQQLQLDLKGA